MSDTSIDTSCTVTNHAGKPVVVLDAFTSATNVTNKSSSKGYQQTLKILSLAGGGQIIADGATGTVTLNDTRTDSNGNVLPNYLYQLLISEPASLFPVMNVGEALSFITTPMSYPPVTVTAAAAKNMSLAFVFCQNLMAYPGSSLATGFVQAMANAQNQPTVTGMMQVIAAYFNTTKSFQGLDFPSYLAVSTYMNAFAWTWGLDATAQPGRTYWLYSSSDAAGATQSSTDNTSPGHGSVTIALKANAPNPADPTDPNSGYTITYQPSSGDSSTLSFNGGQFVDSTSEDVPSICLQGSYALKSLFTHQDGDNVLWPILVGNVGGTKVIGVSQEPADAFVQWLKSLVPKSFDDLVTSFMKIMSVVMAIDFIKTKLTAKKDKLEDDKTNENEGKDPDEEQQKESQSDSEEVEEEALVNNRGRAKRMGTDEDGKPNMEVPDEENVSSAAAESQTEYTSALKESTSDYYNASITETQTQIESLAEINMTPELENAEGNLVQAKQNLQEAEQTGEFSGVQNNLTEAKASINTSMENMNVSEDLQTEIKTSQETAQEYEDSAKDLEGETESVESGGEELPPEVDLP